MWDLTFSTISATSHSCSTVLGELTILSPIRPSADTSSQVIVNAAWSFPSICPRKMYLSSRYAPLVQAAGICLTSWSQANAKSAPKEETPDLSYLGWPSKDRPSLCPPGRWNSIGKGTIIAVALGSSVFLLGLLAIFLVVRRKRLQRKSTESAETAPLLRDEDCQ